MEDRVYFAILATMGTFSDGMHYGWTAPSTVKLREPNSTLPIEESDVVYLESLYLIGGIFSLPLNIPLPDTLGRKYSIIIASSISLLGWLLIIFATSVKFLFFARFCAGIAGNLGITFTSMYISEIAHPRIRGFLTELVSVMELFGIIFVYSIGPFVSIKVPALVSISIIVIQMLLIHSLPESPYYLLSKQKDEKARKALIGLRKDPLVDAELMEMTKGVERQKEEKSSAIDLFRSASNRKAALLIILLNACQHFAGIAVMIMNIHSIFQASGNSSMSQEVASILFSVILLLSTLFFCLLVDKFGRKTLLVYSAFSSAFCLFIIGLHYHLKALGTSFQISNVMLIVTAMSWGIVYELGLGSTPVIMVAELFPVNMKAIGMAFSEFMFMLCATISIYIYNALLNSYGIAIPFYFLSGCTVLSGILSMMYLPETKGKTLEQIQLMLK